MKYLFALCILLGSGIGGVAADPNIYGPGGVNLGPDGELPVTRQKLQEDNLHDEYKEQIKVLQEQVRQLQYEVRLLQQVQQLQVNAQGYPQNQYQVEINYGYPTQNTIGGVWGVPFITTGGGIVVDHKHHGGGSHGRGERHEGSGRGRR